jgi:LmbE family N-acetylglucosaminyl deacetylase
VAYYLTLLADKLLTRQHAPGDLAISADDVYLSPHCDDIAFSIGRFAQARGKGRLVTLFSRSAFTSKPGLGDLPVDAVTALRQAEERRFAEVCGLALTQFDMPEAPLRGFQPTEHDKAAGQAVALGPEIVPKLLALGRERSAADRPWLFAPTAIGGHLDHVIVLLLIAANRTALERRFRLGFYEDLPYSVWHEARVEGLQRFRSLFGLLGWRRCSFPLGTEVPAKLDLMNLYESQHAKPPEIAEYSPECRPPQPPHEAIWVRGGPRR